MIRTFLSLDKEARDKVCKDLLPKDVIYVNKTNALEVTFNQQVLFISKDFFSFSGLDLSTAMEILDIFIWKKEDVLEAIEKHGKKEI